MDDSEAYRKEAIRTAARAILQKNNSIQENDNVIDAIKQGIDLGGGQSFLEEIGPYWAFDYWPGIKISLWRDNEDCEKLSYEYIRDYGHPDDYEPVIHDYISRKEFMAYAREIWNKEKHGQQKLF